jgi:hypothetical protein
VVAPTVHFRFIFASSFLVHVLTLPTSEPVFKTKARGQTASPTPSG